MSSASFCQGLASLADIVQSLVVEYRISRRVREQFEAFMSGFSELIPQELINVFDERELELLIGGMSEIDVYVTHGLGLPFYILIRLPCVATIGPSSRIIAGTR